jgi:hypothetical protein
MGKIDAKWCFEGAIRLNCSVRRVFAIALHGSPPELGEKATGCDASS